MRSRIWILSAVLLSMLFSLPAAPVRAAVISSTATGGPWNAGTSWVGGAVPLATDSVVILAGATITTAGNRTCAGATINGTLSLATGNVLTVNGDIAGTGSLTTAGTTTIALTGGWTFSGTFTPATGTVNFNGAGAQSVGGVTYYNLSTGTGGTKTLGGATTVNGTLTVAAGTTLNTANNLLRLRAFSNNGTFTAGSSNITILGTGNTNVAGFTTTGSLSMTKTSGTATLTGNVSAASLVINGTGGTLSLGTGRTHTISGDWTRTAGTLNGGSSNLLLGGAVVGSGGTFTAGTGTVNFNAAGAQTIPGLTYYNLQATNGGTKTLGGATTVNNTLTVAAGTTLSTASNALSFNAFTNNGTFTAGSSNISLIGAGNRNIPAITTTGTFSTTKTSGTATLTGNLTAGALTVNSAAAATLNLGAGRTHTISGDWTRTAGILNGGSSTLLLGGAVAGSGGTFTAGTGTVNFNAAGAQTIPGLTYYNLTTSTGGTKTLGDATTVNNTLTVAAGTTLNTASFPLGLRAFTNNGTFIAGSSNITILGTGNANVAGFATTGSVSMTKTSGIATLTGNVSAAALTINGTGGTLNLGAAARVHQINGPLTITAGTLNGGAATLRLSGDFSGSGGTFTAGTGTVTFNGLALQTINRNVAIVFNNLIINNPAGLVNNHTGATTVNGILTLTSGVVTSSGSNLIVIGTSGSIAGAGPARYINGSLQKVFGTGAQTFNFAVGDASGYTPVNLVFANVGTAGNVTVRTTAAQHPDIASSLINPARDVNRTWTLTPAGGLAYTTYAATFNFLPADVIGGANPSNFIIQRYAAGWSTPALGTRTATSTQATGLTAMGDFALGEPAAMISTTTVTCLPDPVLVGAGTTCTATVARLSGSNTPGGTVTFGSSGTGNFAPLMTCLLSGSGGSATCGITYTPTVEGAGSHTITASYGGDANFNPSDGTYALDVDEAPTTSGIPVLDVSEDAADSSLDLWPSFADGVDSDGSLIYTLTGNTDPGLFTTVTITGAPNRNLVLDYAPDQNGSSVLTVRATDSDLLWVETSFTVTVDPVNDAPTVLGPLSDVSVSEDAADLPVDLSGVFGDVDIATNADSLTLSLASNSNPGLVTASLVGSTLTLDFQPDQNGTATLRVRATDLAGAFAEDEFLVTVGPVNDPPTDIGLTNDHLAENLPSATTVGILSTIDGDLGDTFGYSLVDTLACPGPDNASFQIGGPGLAELQSAVSFDYETRVSYTVCIRTTDSGGASLERQFVIAIDDVDDLPPSVVSILRQAPAASPTSADSLTFRVTFSEAVQSVSLADFGLAATGTAAASLSAVNMVSADVYDVLVTTAAGNGSLDLQFTLVNDIQDPSGNALGGTPAVGLQESYLLDNQGILINSLGVLGLPGSLPLTDGGSYTTHFTSLTIAFDSDAADPPGNLSADDVSNPANYLLLTPGTNGSFDSPDCLSAPGADDGIVPTGPAVYVSDSGTGEYITTLTLNGGLPLPGGNYRLLLCGTTSITDLFGNPLNDGADERIDFRIYDPAQPSRMPRTGFAPGKVTPLPEQTAGYSALGDLWLDIPRLGVQMPIVGVPLVNGDWDVTWLGADAGWLEGSAYPTGNGNSVLTGHVYDAYGRPGPFAGLNTLRWGDRVVVHAGGVEYVYEVRQLLQVSPGNVNALLKHEELPWITLVTCRGYDPVRAEYRYRVLVRAVLVEIR